MSRRDNSLARFICSYFNIPANEVLEEVSLRSVGWLVGQSCRQSKFVMRIASTVFVRVP